MLRQWGPTLHAFWILSDERTALGPCLLEKIVFQGRFTWYAPTGVFSPAALAADSPRAALRRLACLWPLRLRWSNHVSVKS